MAEVYSTEGLTPEQQDKLGDIVLGDDGKRRRESYAAANVSISDRVLMEEILDLNTLFTNSQKVFICIICTQETSLM